MQRVFNWTNPDNGSSVCVLATPEGFVWSYRDKSGKASTSEEAIISGLNAAGINPKTEMADF